MMTEGDYSWALAPLVRFGSGPGPDRWWEPHAPLVIRAAEILVQRHGWLRRDHYGRIQYRAPDQYLT